MTAVLLPILFQLVIQGQPPEGGPAPATAPTTLPAAPEGMAPGVRVRVYEIGEEMDRLLELAPDQTPNFEEVFASLDLKGEKFGESKTHFRVSTTATLVVIEDAEYAFRLWSDDGSIMFLDERPIIIHDGNHSFAEATGIAHLAPGEYAVRIEHFQNLGDAGLKLEWHKRGEKDWFLLDQHLFIDPTLTPVISPGNKMLMREAALLRPGDGVEVEGIHPMFRLVEIRPEAFEPQVGAMCFLPDGRLAVATFEPINEGTMEEEANGTLWALSNVEAEDRESVTVTKIAEDLYDPAGMAVANGRLLVCETTRLTELIDSDKDGFYETHKTVAGGWITDNYHHFTFGLAVDPADPKYVYVGLSSSVYVGQMLLGPDALRPLAGGAIVGLNGPCPPDRCSIARVNIDTGEVKYIAGGLRTPDGLGFGPGGALFVTENQGAWMPANKLNEVREGHFYGYYPDMRPWNNYPDGGYTTPFQPSETEPLNYTRPALFLPHNEIHNSPTQPLIIPDDPRYGPYRGQLLLGELTRGGVRRAFLEKVGGWYQGAAFRFTQGLEGGVHRIEWGPDGGLYVGMTGYQATWSWRGTKMGLQKLMPTGEAPFEMLCMSARPDGFEITFTRPADLAFISEPANFQLKAWTYVPGPEYGGPKVDEHMLPVESAEPSADGMRVRLVVPGLKEGYVIYLRTDPPSQEGEEIWTTEAWYTLNRIPAEADSKNEEEGTGMKREVE